jgi:hypothetical protein
MDQKCYIISYQLSPARDSKALHDAIKSYGTWANITGNTWAVVTQKSATAVREHLMGFLTANDRIFVAKSGVESAWSNTICRNEWLKKNL